MRPFLWNKELPADAVDEAEVEEVNDDAEDEELVMQRQRVGGRVIWNHEGTPLEAILLGRSTPKTDELVHYRRTEGGAHHFPVIVRP